MPSRSVHLDIGDRAQEERDCESSDCRFLKVELANFESEEHRLDCLLLNAESETTTLLRPQQHFSGQVSTEDCWYDDHEGVILAVVDGVESNRLSIVRRNGADTDEVPPSTDVSTPPDEPPTVDPPDLSPSWNGETWIVLNWLPHVPDAVGDAGTPDEFEVEYRASSGAQWIPSPSSIRYHNGGNIYVYEYYNRIEDLSRLTDYEARVRQCNKSGCSAWSTHLFRTEKPIPPPPKKIRVVDVGVDYFILEWDDVPDAYTYDVYYVGGGSIVSSGSHNPSFVTPFPLEPGTEYEITVNSCNDLQRHGDYGAQACGEIDQGETITVTTER